MSTLLNIGSRNTKYPNDPDQTVWAMMKKNDSKRAFNKIIERYQWPVYRYCYRVLQNRDEAEDATQEVFLRVYTRLDTYDGQHKFSTWLFSIASHYCIDMLRKRRFQLISWDDFAAWHLFPGQDAPQPEEAFLNSEATHEIQILLNALPPDYRTVVILKYWHTLS